MALRLIRDAETVERSIGGTTFVVRLCPHGKFKALRAKHTVRGRVDQEAMNGDILETHVVGWRDLFDADGAAIPFAPELVAKVLMALSEVVAQGLLTIALEPAVKVSDALPNS